jgi:hypothetical protein
LSNPSHSSGEAIGALQVPQELFEQIWFPEQEPYEFVFVHGCVCPSVQMSGGQSFGQLEAFSSFSHEPLLLQVQSLEQFEAVSPVSQEPLLLHGLQTPQSIGQDEQFSEPLQVPSPQKTMGGFVPPLPPLPPPPLE